MKRVGNVESNKVYNPRNVKPQIPIDVDEVDSAMERYVRQKYELRVFMSDSQPGTRSHTGSSSSVEDRPPPLPPKPGKRFGFGLQKSSTLSGTNTPSSVPSGGFDVYDGSPPMNKASRVFGSNVNTSGDGLDSKLATLKDMGFPDERRNSTVLRGVNGNLDKAVETLIRLGEQTSGKSRGNTPTPPAKHGASGLSFDQTPTSSTNPFDALDAVPQQQPQAPPIQTQNLSYGGSATQPTTPSNSYNPFLSQGQGVQYQQQAFPQQQQNFQQNNPFGAQHGLEQSLQGLQLSNPQPQQPLFPNRTGGYGQVSAPFAQSNPFNQSFTPPPMPQIPQQYSSFYQSQQPQQHQQQQQQQYQQPQEQQQQYQAISSPTSPGNPFLKSARSQMFPQTNAASSNPFGQVLHQQSQVQQQVPQQASNPYMMQQQTQSPSSQNPYMMQQQTQSPSSQAPNPFNALQPTYQQPYQQQPQQTTYQQPSHQQQGAYQKNSILALYNYPQLAPQRPEQSQPQPAPTAQAAPTALATGNPFATTQGSQAPQQHVASALPPKMQGSSQQVSRESVDFSGLMGGRHSPDAFSGLSSTYRR
jgi:hypothetical protein